MSVEIEYKTHRLCACGPLPEAPHHVATLTMDERTVDDRGDKRLCVRLNARQCQRLIDYLTKCLPQTE